jgi:hypothetical protein
MGSNSLSPDLVGRLSVAVSEAIKGGIGNTSRGMGGKTAQNLTCQLGVGGRVASPLPGLGGKGSTLGKLSQVGSSGSPQRFDSFTVRPAGIGAGKTYAAPEVTMS